MSFSSTHSHLTHFSVLGIEGGDNIVYDGRFLVRDFQIINMLHNGALAAIDVLVGDTPVIWVDFKAAGSKTCGQLLPK